MFAKVRNWIMHKTNPLHFLCRVITLLDWYEWMWSKFFGVKRITKKQIVESITKARKR